MPRPIPVHPLVVAALATACLACSDSPVDVDPLGAWGGEGGALQVTVEEGNLEFDCAVGQGVNTVTGDYSRGAVGLWIEKGKLTYPVSEVTIGGNLKEIFKDIEVIGSDLDYRSSFIVPTLKIRRMTIAGK